MKRYATKLLFQFRVALPRESSRRRTAEERIVLISATSAKIALKKAKALGKSKEFDYKNDYGHRVFFEFIGVVDLIHLGLEVERNEVWYSIRDMLLPMERRNKIIPREESLSAIRLEVESSKNQVSKKRSKSKKTS